MMEEVISKLIKELQGQLEPAHDEWDRGWNAGIKTAIKRIEAAQQSVQRTACTACGSTLRDEFCRNPDCADYQPAAANASRWADSLKERI